MKFQNCILINFELTDGRRDEPKAICSFNFSKVGGIIKHEHIYIKYMGKFPIGLNLF